MTAAAATAACNSPSSQKLMPIKAPSHKTGKLYPKTPEQVTAFPWGAENINKPGDSKSKILPLPVDVMLMYASIDRFVWVFGSSKRRK